MSKGSLRKFSSEGAAIVHTGKLKAIF